MSPKNEMKAIERAAKGLRPVRRKAAPKLARADDKPSHEYVSARDILAWHRAINAESAKLIDIAQDVAKTEQQRMMAYAALGALNRACAIMSETMRPKVPQPYEVHVEVEGNEDYQLHIVAAWSDARPVISLVNADSEEDLVQLRADLDARLERIY